MRAMLQAHTTSGDFQSSFLHSSYCQFECLPISCNRTAYISTYIPPPPPFFLTLHINALFNKTNEVQVFVNFILFLFKHV